MVRENTLYNLNPFASIETNLGARNKVVLGNGGELLRAGALTTLHISA